MVICIIIFIIYYLLFIIKLFIEDFIETKKTIDRILVFIYYIPLMFIWFLINVLSAHMVMEFYKKLYY